jgi:NAD(P)-dependent dehydrogenase (short-subunit alcohol dehydrogenase family)
MGGTLPDIFNLDGTVALVTGASAGLGAHFAKVLAAAGARVACAARRLDRVETCAQHIRSAGGQACALHLDVTDTSSISCAFNAAETSFGTVTIVVNNAGVAITQAALDMDEADAIKIIDTDLVGAWRVAVEAADRMTGANVGGSIINIGSILAERAAGGVAPYAAAKAGLIQMTRSLGLEWARHDIRVNAINPGYVKTDLNRAFFESDAGERMIRRVPQRRLGKPEDLDGALLLLASDAGRHMTGTAITVDGGHSLGGL